MLTLSKVRVEGWQSGQSGAGEFEMRNEAVHIMMTWNELISVQSERQCCFRWIWFRLITHSLVHVCINVAQMWVIIVDHRSQCSNFTENKMLYRRTCLSASQVTTCRACTDFAFWCLCRIEYRLLRCLLTLQFQLLQKQKMQCMIYRMNFMTLAWTRNFSLSHVCKDHLKRQKRQIFLLDKESCFT